MPNRGATAAVATTPVGLAHDYLLFLRGAERTFFHIARTFNEAPIYTVAYRERETAGWFRGREIRTSPLQRMRVSRGWFRVLLPLYPRAVEALRPDPHDVVVSSSFAFIHGIRVPEGTRHVSYCHSPFRQAWHERERTLAAFPRPLRGALARTLDRIREWDLEASARVDAYIANSRITSERIAEFYGRESEVIHPPVDVDRFRPDPDRVATGADAFLLVVGELVPHKRTEVALEAGRLAGIRVEVVGDGPTMPALRRRFGSSATFHGRLGDAELARLYQRSLAVVLPNVEEFGITAVEGQAAGRPVLALDAGGARETVVPGVTGVLVADPSAAAFAEAMRETDFTSFDPAAARANAERFSAEEFRARLRAAVSLEP